LRRRSKASRAVCVATQVRFTFSFTVCSSSPAVDFSSGTRFLEITAH
jgi:hypothetical protein